MRSMMMRAPLGVAVLAIPFSPLLADQKIDTGVALQPAIAVGALLLGLILGIAWQRKQTRKNTQHIVDRTRELEQEVIEQSYSKEQLHQLAYYDEITSPS